MKVIFTIKNGNWSTRAECSLGHSYKGALDISYKPLYTNEGYAKYVTNKISGLISKLDQDAYDMDLNITTYGAIAPYIAAELVKKFELNQSDISGITGPFNVPKTLYTKTVETIKAASGLST